MKKITTFIFALVSCSCLAQPDSVFIRKIYEEALQSGHSYQNLEYLCTEIGNRLSGSENAKRAVEWGADIMNKYEFESVRLQPVSVPYWVRGQKEKAYFMGVNGKKQVNVTALGNSVGTGEKGIMANLVEVTSKKQLKELTRDQVENKIVFINIPMPLSMTDPMEMYSNTAFIRSTGPREVSKLGALGAVVRSLSTTLDDIPHTGVTSFGREVKKIPAIAISTRHAESLSAALKADPTLSFYFETHCEMKGEVPSHNVIGELGGTENPENIILVSGHLDSWDVGQGAHDDGAGLMHALEALRILKTLGYQPKNTLRVVFFMNEENGLAGGKNYASHAQQSDERHIAALESDNGGFLPLGFGMDADEKVLNKINSWSGYFAPYHLHEFVEGWGGSDIKPLKSQGVPLIGLKVNTQKYFDLHHSALDTFDQVNRRELEMGCAAMAALIYLIDQYGL